MTEPDAQARARRLLALPPAVEHDEDGQELHPFDGNGAPNLSDVSPRYMRELARPYSHEMLEILVEIARNRSSSDTAKISAAKEVLLRGWGSPGSEADLLKIWLDANPGVPIEDPKPTVFQYPMTVDYVDEPQDD